MWTPISLVIASYPALAPVLQRMVTHARVGQLLLEGCVRPETLDAPLSAQPNGFYYSMTSSARCSSAGGTVRPSAFAVFRLITSSNLVGCWTGRSAGLAPLRIFPTYMPT